MNADSNLHVYLRIILISALVAVLGLFPSLTAFNNMLEKSRQAADAGDWSDAATYLGNASGYYPWKTGLSLQAARYAVLAGDMPSAIRYFEQPWVLSHLTTSDLVSLGDAYKETGDISKASATWKRAADLSNSAAAMQRLADMYAGEKDYPSAIAYLLKLLAINPSDADLYYRVGLFYAISQPLQALPYLAQAASIDPQLADKANSLHDKIRTASLFDKPGYTLLAAGRELANQGEWSLASQAFRQATVLDPGYADAWAFLGEAEQQSKASSSPSDAIGLAELERALQLDAQSVLANLLTGIYWERQQDFSKAQGYLEAAIKITPEDPYLYVELGNILAKAGDLPGAQSEYEKAIHVAPRDPTFYRLLAQFALEYRIQIRELALPSARQALMLNPQDPASLDMLAQVMLELQDYHSAQGYCLEALSVNPTYIPAYLHLGTSYLYLGNSSQAYHWLKLAMDNGQGMWVGDQATRMLDYYFP